MRYSILAIWVGIATAALNLVGWIVVGFCLAPAVIASLLLGIFGFLLVRLSWWLARKSSTTMDGDRERWRLEEKIRRVRQGLLDGVLDNETAKREVLAAEAALATLREQDDAHIQEAEALTDIHQLWPHMTMEERRDLVRLVLAKVEVDLGTGGVEGLTPKPVFAPLLRVLAEEEDRLISVCDWRPRGGSGSPIVNLSALGRA